MLNPAKALATYSQTFLTIGLWGVAAGVLLLALSPWLKRWAHGVNEMHPQPELDGDRQSAHPRS